MRVKQYILLFIFCFVFFSCQNDIKMQKPIENEASTLIYFGNKEFDDVTITTRATIPEYVEDRLQNLVVYVFDNHGILKYARFFDVTSREFSEQAVSTRSTAWYYEEATFEGDVYTHGAIKIASPNVTNGHLYIVANLDEDLFNFSRGKALLVKNESTLQNMIFNFVQQTSFRMGSLMMVGHSSVTINDGNITFNPTGLDPGTYGESQWRDENVLLLEGVDAKIIVNVGADQGFVTQKYVKNSAGEDVLVNITMEDFIAESWQVINLPNGSDLFKQGMGATSEEIGGYFDTEVHHFESVQNNMSSFSFYMLENRQSINKKGSVIDPALQAQYGQTGYHLRERRLRDESGAYASQYETDWVFAPDDATYLIIKGTVIGSYDITGIAPAIIEGECTYYIHLGDFGSSTNSPTVSFDNYDVLRNTCYTYNIFVRGAHQVTVEVMSDQDGYDDSNETQSGATGNVAVSLEADYMFDSHYGQRVFRVNAPMLLEWVGDPDNLTWYVDTPFSHQKVPLRVGVERLEVVAGLDYQWVHFLLNSKEQSYIEPHGGPGGTPIEVTNPQYPNYSQLNRMWPEDGVENEELYDVASLCVYLRKQLKLYKNEATRAQSDFDSEGNIYVTTFVDEFYYDADPISGEVRPNMWREFVNKPVRRMHILCDTHESLDAESTYTNGAITLKQRSIQTIYNTRTSHDAWGTEYVDEFKNKLWFFNRTESRTEGSNTAPFLPNTAKNRSKENGLYNTIHLWDLASADGTQFVNDVPWSNYMDYIRPNDYTVNNVDIEFLKDDDEIATMRYACMARNRDNNGNGFIDPDEVRWYLASTGQLQQLFIGDQALEIDAKLYNVERVNEKTTTPGNAVWKWRSHIVSSTAENRLGGVRPSIVWAEEGCSFSPYGSDNQWRKPGAYSVRCVRNLYAKGYQEDVLDVNEVPNPPFTATQNPDGTYTFDLTDLNIESKAIATSFPAIPMNENAYVSRPSNKFQSGVVGNNGESISRNNYVLYYNNLLNGQAYCPEGWRSPNIREMAIAYYAVPSNDYNFWISGYEWMVSTPYSFGSPVTGGNDFDTHDQIVYSWYFSTSNITLTPNNINIGGYIRCVRDIIK